jgi:hypothetical protein
MSAREAQASERGSRDLDRLHWPDGTKPTDPDGTALLNGLEGLLGSRGHTSGSKERGSQTGKQIGNVLSLLLGLHNTSLSSQSLPATL